MSKLSASGRPTLPVAGEDHARLTIDLSALADNWRAMDRRSGAARTAAVLKADAYGIGLEPAAKTFHQAGARDFFVATPAEGAAVRAVLPDARIYVLSGMWAGAERLFFEFDLVPVIVSEEQLVVFMSAIADGGDIPCVLHVDTGMSRLGLRVEDALALAEDIARPASFSPIMLLSHLACADEPSHALNRKQLQRFRSVVSAFGDIDATLANSAGIFLGEDYHFTLTRPGIALYGGAAVNGVPNPMKPVVTAEARILQVRDVKAGESVGYGAAVICARDTRVAIAAIGYADGYMRSLSSAGIPLRQTGLAGPSGMLHGSPVPIIGRVTMDLTHFDVTDLPARSVRPGDFIELFGRTMPIEDVARAAGTVDYELLTSLGNRYERRYEALKK